MFKINIITLLKTTPVTQINKSTSAFYASVLLLVMNFIITLILDNVMMKYFDNVTTKSIVNNRTDALKIDINLFFTITDCQISRSRSLMRCTNFKFIRLSAYWPQNLAYACVNFCSYRKILVFFAPWITFLSNWCLFIYLQYLHCYIHWNLKNSTHFESHYSGNFPSFQNSW